MHQKPLQCMDSSETRILWDKAATVVLSKRNPFHRKLCSYCKVINQQLFIVFCQSLEMLAENYQKYKAPEVSKRPFLIG